MTTVGGDARLLAAAAGASVAAFRDLTRAAPAAASAPAPAPAPAGAKGGY